MNGAGDQFFAGTRFPFDNDVATDIGNLFDGVIDLLHYRRMTDHTKALSFVAQLTFEQTVFFHQGTVTKGFTNQDLQLIHVKRLFNKIVCTET